MKEFLIVAVLALVCAAPAAASQIDGWQMAPTRTEHKAPRHHWDRIDRNIHPSLRLAARTFHVSYGWLHSCNHAEGGHVSSRRLHVSLRTGAQPGWNKSGTRAFGAMQFMLGAKPAKSWRDWGTFKKYMRSAFVAAQRRGVAVPVRFRRPDSNLGQAVVAAYMFSHRMSGQWTGGGC